MHRFSKIKKVIPLLFLTLSSTIAHSKDALITDNQFANSALSINKDNLENLEMCASTTPDCSNALAVAYLYGKGVDKNFKKAEHYFLNSVKLGDGLAHYHLGVMFKDGLIDGTVNLKSALKHFELGAALDNSYAQVMAASAYAMGEGTDINNPKALNLYLLAAAQDSALAQQKACHFYIYGWGTTRDFEKSFSLCSKAALNGQITALVDLANHYYEGAYVSKDIIKAYALMQASKELGNTKIEQYLPKVRSQLTPVQIEKSQNEKEAIIEGLSNGTLKTFE